jgi:hypothetical protein
MQTGNITSTGQARSPWRVIRRWCLTAPRFPTKRTGRSGGGYAGLSARLAEGFRDRRPVSTEQDLTFENDRHRSRADGLEYSGTIDGRPAGIAVLSHPENVNSPSPWYVIKSRPMTFFSPAVICYGPLTLEPNHEFTLRYRVIVHLGKWNRDKLREASSVYQNTNSIDDRRSPSRLNSESRSRMKHTDHRTSRREFLKQSAAAAAAGTIAFPTIVSSKALGANAPSNRVNIASLGVGSQGSYLMRGFVKHEDAQFLAVCDPYKSKREAAGKLPQRTIRIEHSQSVRGLP